MLVADSISNNTISTALNLGTISYDAGGTSFNIYQTDSLGSDDKNDYFIITTEGVGELKVDIHPTGLIGDYKSELAFSVWQYPSYEDFISSPSTPLDMNHVRLLADGGEYDGSLASRVNLTGWEPVSGDENYVLKETTTWDGIPVKSYIIYDQNYFNYSFDPHLVNSINGSALLISVDSQGLETPTHNTFGDFEDLSYVIDITPISASATFSAESHLASYGVSIDAANDFIMSNLSSLSFIHNTCKTFGVTNDMIAEILADDFPGLDGTTVANFFASNGIDSSDLGGSAPTVDVVGVSVDYAVW
jgi:hypothetical protein